MSLNIGTGITIGPGISFSQSTGSGGSGGGGGGGGNGVKNTYVLGVDYFNAGPSMIGVTGMDQFSAYYFQVKSAYWTNSAGPPDLSSLPIGTALTYVVGGTSYTATTTSTGPYYDPTNFTITVNFNGTPPFLYGTAIESISHPK